MAQNDRIKLTTPKGVAIWPSLNTPDTKFNAAGKYGTRLAFDGAEPLVQAFQARLEKIRDDFYDTEVERLKADKKAGLAAELTKAPVLKPERDPETGLETGRLIYSASMTASGVSKKTGKPWTMSPDLFDAKGTKLKNPPAIYGGSEMKLSVEVDAFVNQTSKQVMVSARLNAAQIIKLVSGGNRDSSDYGFAEEDGDEIADQAPATGGFADETGTGDDDI